MISASAMRIKALEEKVEAGGSGGEAVSSDVKQLREQVGKLELVIKAQQQSLGTLRESSSGTGAPKDVKDAAALLLRLGKAEARLQASEERAASLEASLEDAVARIAALEARPVASPPVAATPAVPPPAAAAAAIPPPVAAASLPPPPVLPASSTSSPEQSPATNSSAPSTSVDVSALLGSSPSHSPLVSAKRSKPRGGTRKLPSKRVADLGSDIATTPPPDAVVTPAEPASSSGDASPAVTRKGSALGPRMGLGVLPGMAEAVKGGMRRRSATVGAAQFRRMSAPAVQTDMDDIQGPVGPHLLKKSAKRAPDGGVPPKK